MKQVKDQIQKDKSENAGKLVLDNRTVCGTYDEFEGRQYLRRAQATAPGEPNAK